MKAQASPWFVWAALISSFAIGCGSPATSTPLAPDLSGNWQIEAALGTSPAPSANLLLLGALASSGNQVTGMFRFTNLSQPTSCGLDQVVTVTGSVGSNNNLTLISSALPNGATVKIFLGMTSGLDPIAGNGTIEVDGATCAVATEAATGVQIANTTGAFTGTLSPGTLISPGSGPSGTATLKILQSSSPTANGEFAATGSFQFAIGTCSVNIPISGNASGVGLILSGSDGASPTPQTVSLIATTNFGATSLTAAGLEFIPVPCSSAAGTSTSYFGTMNRQ